MTTPTITTGRASEAAHWYSWPDARPIYQIENKSKPGTFRPVTLADARKMNPLPFPSVTGVIRIVPSEAIIQYRIRQAVLAALTIPDAERAGLDDDAVMERVRASADEERDAAADLGTRIHAAIGQHLAGQQYDEALRPYFLPMLAGLEQLGYVLISSGRAVVSASGYGGLTDATFRRGASAFVVDFKTQKRKGGKFAHWPEVGLQLAAYADALAQAHPTTPHGGLSVAIATDEPGPHEAHEWFTPGDADGQRGYYLGEFMRRLECWKWAKGYYPKADTP